MLATALRSLGYTAVLGRVDVEAAVNDMHCPCPQPLSAGRARRAAGADIEAPLVERTFDLAPDDQALRQGSGTMSTMILSDIKLPIAAEDCVGNVVTDDLYRCIGPDIGSGT